MVEAAVTPTLSRQEISDLVDRIWGKFSRKFPSPTAVKKAVEEHLVENPTDNKRQIFSAVTSGRGRQLRGKQEEGSLLTGGGHTTSVIN